MTQYGGAGTAALGTVVRLAGRRRDQGRQQGRRRADPDQPACAAATTGSTVRIVRIVRQRGFIGRFVGRSHRTVGVFMSATVRPRATHRRGPIAFGRFGRSYHQFGWRFWRTRVKHLGAVHHLALAEVALMGGRLVVAVPVGSAAAVQ